MKVQKEMDVLDVSLRVLEWKEELNQCTTWLVRMGLQVRNERLWGSLELRMISLIKRGRLIWPSLRSPFVFIVTVIILFIPLTNVLGDPLVCGYGVDISSFTEVGKFSDDDPTRRESFGYVEWNNTGGTNEGNRGGWVGGITGGSA
ncbi:hypothetical protein BDFG_03995 [Blastomyces dermatitidis ATCC 26199]|nr:hypothetical protein BDFG_03995 [Blastomyces dermatitidis ATCC 26199]